MTKLTLAGLTKRLNERDMAIEVIEWLRDNDLLKGEFDDEGVVELAEQFAFTGSEIEVLNTVKGAIK